MRTATSVTCHCWVFRLETGLDNFYLFLNDLSLFTHPHEAFLISLQYYRWTCSALGKRLICIPSLALVVIIPRNVPLKKEKDEQCLASGLSETV